MPVFIEKEDVIGKVVIVDSQFYYYADTTGFLLPFFDGSENACIRTFNITGELILSTEKLRAYAVGPPIGRICEEGLLLMGSAKSIFLIANSTRQEFQSFGAFAGRGYDTSDVINISDRLLHKIRLGPPLY